MKLFSFAAPFLLLLPSCLMGNNLPVCGVASLATYISYGTSGCSVGTGFVFEDFEYVAEVDVLANAISASQVTVTPTIVNNTPSFTFSANWGIDNPLGTGTFTAILGFRGIATTAAFSAFNSVQLVTVGSNSSGIATNAVTEEDCVGGLLTGALCSVGGGTTSNIGAQILGANLGANAAVSFTPATSIDVIKTISLVSALGSDDLTSVGQVLGTTATPEPMSFSMIGGGLLLVGLAARKRLIRTS